MKRLGLALCFPLLFSLLAARVSAAGVEVADGWIRLLPAGVPAAGYFELRNGTNAPVKLVGAASPAFGLAMLHRTVEENGRSTMQHLHQVEVPAGDKLAFTPGGHHIMFMKPVRALKVGDEVPVTLEFANGEKLSTRFEVRGPSGR